MINKRVCLSGLHREALYLRYERRAKVTRIRHIGWLDDEEFFRRRFPVTTFYFSDISRGFTLARFSADIRGFLRSTFYGANVA